MVFIIEGPDGAGKTTLANKILAASPGAELKHFGAPANEEEANNYWKVYLKAISDAAGKVVIFDRSWYSDMVYAPIMRGKEEMNRLSAECLEHAVRSMGGGLVIYCTGVQRKLWSRCLQRGETYIKNADQHNQICKKYDEVIHEIKLLPVVVYNTTSEW